MNRSRRRTRVHHAPITRPTTTSGILCFARSRRPCPSFFLTNQRQISSAAFPPRCDRGCSGNRRDHHACKSLITSLRRTGKPSRRSVEGGGDPLIAPNCAIQGAKKHRLVALNRVLTPSPAWKPRGSSVESNGC